MVYRNFSSFFAKFFNISVSAYNLIDRFFVPIH